MDVHDLKILFVISKMGKGGAQRIVLDLANLMAAAGASVDILVFFRTPQDASILAELDPRIHLMDLLPIWLGADHENSLQKSFALLLFSVKALWWGAARRLQKYHVVHANLLLASVFVSVCSLFWSAGSRSRPVLVETFHADLPTLQKWERTLFKFLWKRRDRLIVELRKRDVGILQRVLPADRVVYIPFGIHPQEAPAGAQLEAARKSYDGRPVILSVTRLNQREKKTLDLIRIVHRFSQLHQGPFLFLLVGDGPDKAQAQKLVDELGLTDCVRFTGYLDDFSALCVVCKAFLIAGVEDLVGIAGLQAASLGSPIVSFQMDPEWEEGQGLFWNSRSYDALAGELEKLVSDPVYYQRASGHAAEMVHTRFSARQMAASTLDLYLSLLSGRSRERD